MQVFNLAARSLDLHVLGDFIRKQVAVVSHQNDALDPVVGQHSHTTPQMTQYAVDLKPSLRHIVGLAKLIDFLRRDQDQLRILNALPDPPAWLWQQIFQLGLKYRSSRMLLQERHSIFTILDDLAA